MISRMVLAPPEGEGGVPANGPLSATFQVTTYVAPTGQGLTAGATSEGPVIEEGSTP